MTRRIELYITRYAPHFGTWYAYDLDGDEPPMPLFLVPPSPEIQLSHPAEVAKWAGTIAQLPIQLTMMYADSLEVLCPSS